MKVKVIEACEIAGTMRQPGDIIEQPDEVLAELVEAGKVSVEADAPAEAPAPAPEAPAEAPAPAPATEAAPAPTAAPTNENQPGDVVMQNREVSQADLDTNPILVELGAKAGDTCQIVLSAKPVDNANAAAQ